MIDKKEPQTSHKFGRAREGVKSVAPWKMEDEAEANRGRRAPRQGSGPVTGSGAGAGGGGNPEEIDDDLQI